MAANAGIKLTDDSKTIQKKLDKFTNNLSDSYKNFLIEQAINHKISHLEDDLKRFMILTHTTDKQKEIQISLMESLVIYRKILEDFEKEDCS